jgi:hypothetical protein
MFSLAEDFKNWVVSRLPLSHSAGENWLDRVKLIWIEPVETSEARRIWSDCENRETQPEWTNKINIRCSCFHLPCLKGEFIVASTLTYSKGNILVQSGLRTTVPLER